MSKNLLKVKVCLPLRMLEGIRWQTVMMETYVLILGSVVAQMKKPTFGISISYIHRVSIQPKKTKTSQTEKRISVIRSVSQVFKATQSNRNWLWASFHWWEANSINTSMGAAVEVRKGMTKSAIRTTVWLGTQVENQDGGVVKKSPLPPPSPPLSIDSRLFSEDFKIEPEIGHDHSRWTSLLTAITSTWNGLIRSRESCSNNRRTSAAKAMVSAGMTTQAKRQRIGQGGVHWVSVWWCGLEWMCLTVGSEDSICDTEIKVSSIVRWDWWDEVTEETKRWMSPWWFICVIWWG